MNRKHRRETRLRALVNQFAKIGSAAAVWRRPCYMSFLAEWRNEYLADDRLLTADLRELVKRGMVEEKRLQRGWFQYSKFRFKGMDVMDEFPIGSSK